MAKKVNQSGLVPLKRSAIETVEVPSRRLAAQIAAEHNSSASQRAEFARTLVNDAKARARISLKKVAVAS
jgi:hypothetical protein